MKTLNKKVILSMMLAILLAPAAVSAGVYFMEKVDDDAEAGDIVRPCVLDYPKRSCPDGLVAQNLCPADNSYFQTCGCDTDIYKFDASNCKDNKTLGGNTCSGKYDTCGCDDKYKFDSTNCADPKVLSGNSCEGKYETCLCPTTYSKTCSAPMISVETACDGKYKACKCPDNFTTCNYGEAGNAAQCTEEDGTVKWDNCKTATCNSDEVNVDTYFGGKLGYFMNTSGARTVGSIRCIKLPICENFGFTSGSCSASVKCPFDKSKIWCPF